MDLGGEGRRSLATEPATSRRFWFLGTLAIVRNPAGAPQTPAVIELTIPPGGSPPSHVHDTLDDSFLMLQGEVVGRCGEETFVARPGCYVALPAGIEHTFRVTSQTPAKMLLVHANDDFLKFIEEVGTPADSVSLPQPGEHDLDRNALIAAAAMYDVRIVGPNLDEAKALELTARA